MHNLVPFRLRLANNKALEQLVHLLGISDCKIVLGLQTFLEIEKLFLALLLLGLHLVI